MIIIRVQGGMGNQLFQYALYEELKNAGKDVKIDVVTYAKGNEPRKYRLEEVFGIQMPIASHQEIFRIVGGENSFFQKVVRKFLKKRNMHKEIDGITLEQILQMEKGYLNGYWQSVKWFPNVKNQIKDQLTFMNIDDSFRFKCETVSKENSVSIHVRLGDYLQNETMYGGICTKEYYEKAICYIKKHVDNPTFYVLSDEPEKAKMVLDDVVDAIYMDELGAEEKDLIFISSCHHNILANSSFSWWGTYLNKHTDKIVIAPSKWNNVEDYSDIYQEEWIRL